MPKVLQLLYQFLPPFPSSLILSRFFFKSFCEDIADAIMEEISDDEVVLPHYEGKIIARVEKVA